MTSIAESQLLASTAVLDRLIPLTQVDGAFSADLYEHLGAAWLQQVHALVALGRHDEARRSAARWLEHLGAQADPASGLPVECWPYAARAFVEQAQTLMDTGDAAAALSAFDEMQRRFEHASALAVREWLARAALANLQLRARSAGTFTNVDLVRRTGELEARFQADGWPATRVLVAKFRQLRGSLLAALDYDDAALAQWDALWQDSGDSAEGALRAVAADAKLEQGRLLARLQRWPQALASHQELTDALAGSSHPDCIDVLAWAHLDCVMWWDDGHVPVPEGNTPCQHVRPACEAMEAALRDAPASTTVDRCMARCLVSHAWALRMRAHELSGEHADGDLSEETREFVQTLRVQARELAGTLWTRYGHHPASFVRRSAVWGWRAAIAQDREHASPAERVAAYQDVLRQRGDDPEEELQDVLVRVWESLAHTQHDMEAYDEAQASLTAVQRRFAHVTDPEVRQRLAQLAATQASWLVHDQQRYDEALALLDVQPDMDGDEEDRWLAMRRQATRALLWRANLPASE